MRILIWSSSQNAFEVVGLLAHPHLDYGKWRIVSSQAHSFCPNAILASFLGALTAVPSIVRNGLHYTADGTQVEVRLSCSRTDDGEYAVIVVMDDGPGVPEDVLGELFRPFYRVEEARDRLSGGSGLGLAIAERIIRLHGGALTATNASEKGLQVEIRIPLAPPTPPPSQRHRLSAPGS